MRFFEAKSNPADDLRSRQAELYGLNQSVLEQAQAQNCDLSDNEAQEFDERAQQIDSLSRQLSRLDQYGRQGDMLASPQPRRVAPGQPGRGQYGMEGARGGSLGRQIVTHPKFQAWAAADGAKSRMPVTFTIQAQSDWPDPVPVLNPTVRGPEPQPTGLRSLIPEGAITGGAVTFFREDPAGTDWLAGYQSDYLTQKKELKVKLDPVTQMVAQLAGFIRVPLQMLEDLPNFETYVNGRLTIGLNAFLEQELATGTGSAIRMGTIQGLLPLAAEAAAAGSSDNLADQVLAAANQIQANGYTPDGVCFSPSAWSQLATAKTTFGGYILTGVPTYAAQLSLWGLRCTTSFALTGNADFLVGAFQQGSTLLIRSGTDVRISFEDQNDFVINAASIRCEMRACHGVWAPAAFIKKTATVTANGASTTSATDKAEKKSLLK
jgi:HK97 family phage major capsid protein